MCMRPLIVQEGAGGQKQDTQKESQFQERGQSFSGRHDPKQISKTPKNSQLKAVFSGVYTGEQGMLYLKTSWLYLYKLLYLDRYKFYGLNCVHSKLISPNYQNDSTLVAESEEELKSLSMKVKEESEKVGLKLNIQKTKIMASGPITSWQIDGETVADFVFLGSKITADHDCSHEIKRRLVLGRKVMTNLDSILKSRDITLPTKVCLVKAMVFPVVMYGCESWTIKKAEC